PERLQTAWETTSSDSENRQICTVCGLRPQGRAKKFQERKVCDVCEGRRQERSKGWVRNMGNRSTIWMNEVADHNGRLALLVGQFGLEHWLSGEVLNSVMMMDPLQRRLVDERKDKRGNKIRHEFEFDYTQLLTECRLAENNPNSPLDAQQAELLDNLMLDISRGNAQNLVELYDLYISDTDLHNSTKREGWRLALALMRQQPSFARIRRLWETTQGFWHTVEQDLRDSVGQTGPRLQITGETSSLDNLGKFHAYELVTHKGVTINAVWDPNNTRFISADNLERITRLMGEDADNLSGHTLTIQEPGGYGNPAKFIGNLEKAALNPIPGSEYIPAIVILKEPRTFMAIVPAKNALTVIEHIRQKYNREMGKVRNRLPMRLGAVFAPQHTPLRALMDAGWRMLRGASLPQTGWEITAITAAQDTPLPKELADNPHFKHYRNIRLQQEEGRQIYWKVPLSMADGKTEDAWYPYAFVEHPAPEHPITRRQRYIQSLTPWREANPPHDLVHVKDLVPGDVVSFTPDTFDFMWLGSAAQRVSIAYDSNGQRYELPRRPYLLDELPHLYQIWETFKAHLSISQIYILRDTIERKREEWLPTAEESRDKNGVFWQFCRDTVANAQWKNKHWDTDELDRWADYAVKGWLTDAVELYLHIMKHKIQESPQKEDVHDGIQSSHSSVPADERGPGSHWNRW
ncbi:MAG: CRISPR-associated protein Csx11, partial [Anaerolineae bacterium]